MRSFPLRAVLLSCIALNAHAGTVFETAHRDLGADDQHSSTVMRVQDGKLRIEHQGQGDSSVMIFKDDVVHALDASDKSYRVIDRATVRQLADQINPALQQVQEQLQNMSPEQRAMVEKMIGGQMPQGGEQPAEIAQTGRKDTIAGLNCSYVEVRRAGKVEQELCVAPATALTGGQEMLAVARKMSALMEEMMAAFDTPWLRQTLNQNMQPYSRLDGFPVFSRYYANGKPVLESTLKSMRSENIAASQFEVPPDYQRKDILPTR